MESRTDPYVELLSAFLDWAGEQLETVTDDAGARDFDSAALGARRLALVAESLEIAPLAAEARQLQLCASARNAFEVPMRCSRLEGEIGELRGLLASLAA